MNVRASGSHVSSERYRAETVTMWRFSPHHTWRRCSARREDSERVQRVHGDQKWSERRVRGQVKRCWLSAGPVTNCSFHVHNETLMQLNITMGQKKTHQKREMKWIKHISLCNNYSNVSSLVSSGQILKLESGLSGRRCWGHRGQRRGRIKSVLRNTAERCAVNVEEKKSWHLHVRP